MGSPAVSDRAGNSSQVRCSWQHGASSKVICCPCTSCSAETTTTTAGPQHGLFCLLEWGELVSSLLKHAVEKENVLAMKGGENSYVQGGCSENSRASSKAKPSPRSQLRKTRVDVTELSEVQGGPVPGAEEILAQAQGTGSSRHSTT